MTKTSYQYLQTDTLTENFKVNLVLKNFNSYFQSLTDKHKNMIELQMNCRELEIRFDWFWLVLCLQNLLRNAFEHGAGKVSLKVQASEKQLSLSVIDEGRMQIPAEDLFRPFKKNHQSHGLGLGLSIVHKILSFLHVELKYISEPQTEFKIIIPRKHYEYTFN